MVPNVDRNKWQLSNKTKFDGFIFAFIVVLTARCHQRREAVRNLMPHCAAVCMCCLVLARAALYAFLRVLNYSCTGTPLFLSILRFWHRVNCVISVAVATCSGYRDTVFRAEKSNSVCFVRIDKDVNGDSLKRCWVLCRIWGFHASAYEEFYLFGCNVV
jgi:hypothetical protein